MLRLVLLFVAGRLSENAVARLIAALCLAHAVVNRNK